MPGPNGEILPGEPGYVGPNDPHTAPGTHPRSSMTDHEDNPGSMVDPATLDTIASAFGGMAKAPNFILANYQAIRPAMILSNSIASEERVNGILERIFTQHKITNDREKQEILLTFLLFCADNGTSGYIDCMFKLSTRDATLTCGSVIITIKRTGSTVRQFCSFFAPLVFDYCVRNDRPPANWIRKGATENTKFAAFDFFNGVEHSAAMRLPQPFFRKPTIEELTYAQASAKIAIMRSRNQRGGMQTTYSEATGGFLRGQNENFATYATPSNV